MGEEQNCRISIEITPDMLAAGVEALQDAHLGTSLETVAEDVFWAMIAAYNFRLDSDSDRQAISAT